jgi:hypothetical protein
MPKLSILAILNCSSINYYFLLLSGISSSKYAQEISRQYISYGGLAKVPTKLGALQLDAATVGRGYN